MLTAIKISVMSMILLISLLIRPADARVIIFVKDYTYQASEIDSKVTCRAIALEQVKRLLLEELGTYLESKTEVKNFQLTQDQITTLTAGIVSAVVVSEKWDGSNYYLKAKISADPNEVATSVDKLRNDFQKTKELEETKKMADSYAAEIKRLNKELDMAKIRNPDQQPAVAKIKEYNKIVDELTATDLFFKALQIFNDGNYKNALDEYNKVLRLNPNHATAYVGRGVVYEKLGESQRAINDYSKAIELNPRHANAYCNRGLMYNKEGRFKVAIDDFNNAIEIAPNYSQAFEGRGTAYSYFGDKKIAIENYSKAISLDPNNIAAYTNRGNVYNDLLEYQLAIRDYEKAIKINPKRNEPYIGLSNTYSNLGDSDGDKKNAIENFSKAISLDPNNIAAYTKRGNVYNDLLEYQLAINDFEKAIKINPKRNEPYSGLAYAYSNLGDNDRAIKELKRAAQLGNLTSQKFLNDTGISWQ
jgi:tetratricopeptide (TPR) repeat protein